jgi:hypothetical protein
MPKLADILAERLRKLFGYSDRPKKFADVDARYASMPNDDKPVTNPAATMEGDGMDAPPDKPIMYQGPQSPLTH